MKKNVKFRNHFLMVIENLCSLWILWIYLFISIFSDESFDEKLGNILVCGGVILFVLILNVITWRKTTYIFDENALIVEKSTITKTTSTIAMNNIATVNVNRSLIQAILGIRKVKVDINSTAATNSEVEIYLSTKDAVQFQQIIMSFVGGDTINDKAQDDNKVIANEEDVRNVKNVNKDAVVKDSGRASVEDILLHCIYTMQIVTIIITAIAGGFLVLSEAELEEGDSVGGAMSVLTIVILVIGVIISFFKSFFAYYKLEAVRSNNEISITYGFFDKKTFKIPVNRIVAIKIKEPLIGRLFKKAYAEIVCIGIGDEDKELSLISLCTSKTVLAAKLHMLLPEFIPEEVKNADELYNIKREDKRAIYVRMGKSIFYMASLVIGALMGISIFGDSWTELIGIFGFIILFVCAMIFIYGICKNKTSGYMIDKRYFRIATGAFNKETRFVPYDKIEHMTINKSPVYKLFGLALATVHTKSGILVGEIINTCYINDKDIKLILNKYKESYKR